MNKAVQLIIAILWYGHCFAQPSFNPGHQRAGELSYQLVGAVNDDGAPTPYYHFTLKLLKPCQDSIYPLLPLFIHDITANKELSANWSLDSASNRTEVADPCIGFPEAPCYRFYYYHTDVSLNFNRNGYLVFYGDCCRGDFTNLRTNINPSPFVNGVDLHLGWGALDPVRPASGNIGNSAAYQFTIPSRFTVNSNSSPVFNSGTDTILSVCINQPFSHKFSASDIDGDSLSYSFYPSKVMYAEGSSGSINIKTSNAQDASYIGPLYSGTQPLGENVTIDAKTGTISGSMHDTGNYIFTIAAYEYRSGKLLTAVPHTREAILRVLDCTKLPTPKAILPPLLNSCNSTTVTLNNLSTPYHPELNWDNNKYLWDLGDGDTSHARYPVHYYDTGVYNVRLITMPGLRCADTAYSKVLVYPSVRASFYITGNGCTNLPVKFTNTSSADIGSINSLTWHFVNLKDSSSFTSNLSNPSYSFKMANQTYAAILNVTTTKGCEARDTQYIDIRQSPLPLQTHDTIITSGTPYKIVTNSGYDSSGSTYLWSPPTGLSDVTAANPIATGINDITYKVIMNNMYNCTLTDTVHIKYYKGPEIYLPAAFTPNNDGKNDVFRPFTVGIQKLEYFRVYNRWGNLLYQTQTYMAGWNGYVNGKLAPAGSYIYEARGVDLNNKTVFKKGSVLLIR